MSGSDLIERLFVADPGLWDDTGHHLATSEAIQGAARAAGMHSEILGCKRYAGHSRVQHVFTQSLYDAQRYERLSADAGCRSGPLLDQNSIDLLLFAEQARLTRADAIFFHTVTINFLASLMDYFVTLAPGQAASHHFLFRYDPTVDGWAGSAATLAETVRRLRGLDLLGRRIFLYAETDALEEVYSEICGIHVGVLYHFSVIRSGGAPERTGGKVRLGYFGEARIEKGIDAYHRAVESSLDQLEARAEFATQCYASSMNRDAAIDAAQEFFSHPRYNGRHRLLGRVNDDVYQQELLACDVLVLPHRAPQYSRRGSGIFVDGIVHGKIMVLRAGTWMAGFCPPGLAVTFASDAELGPALAGAVELAERRRRGPAAPAPVARLFDAQANVHAILRNHIVTRGGHPRTQRLRVLHIAPLWLRQGSTRVYEAQLRMLRDIDATVACVHLANFPLGENELQSTYRWYLDQAPAEGAVYQWLVELRPEAAADASAIAGELVGRPLSWANEWIQAHSYQVPQSLARFAASGVDLVVLNYAHNLPLVQQLGLSNVPVIVETHDNRAKQFGSLTQAVDISADEAAEMVAQRAASATVFINREEAAAAGPLLGGKPAITVLPTLPLQLDPAWRRGLDRGDAAQRSVTMQRVATRAKGGPDHHGALYDFFVAIRRAGDRPERLLCFLGSSHHWNMESLYWFYDEVFAPHLLPQGRTLIVAGTAGASFLARRGPQPGVMTVGELADVRFLYESGIAFVLPVRGGTGFPIKSLEALLAGVPTVGTSHAFRGFPDLAGLASRADDPLGFAEAVLRLGTPEGAAATRAKPPVLSWDHYVGEWGGLIERLTGRALRRRRGGGAHPAEAPVMAADGEVPKLVPLVLDGGGWTCTAETQPAFLAASRGFRPSPSETTYCWAAAYSLALALAFAGPAEAIEISVDMVMPEADDRLQQTVHVFLDGASIGKVMCGPGEFLVIPLDGGWDGTGLRQVELELIIPNARFGMVFNGWTDQRGLSFATSQIRIIR